MSYTLAVSNDIAEAAEEMAQRSGQSRDSLLLNALRVYFPPIPAELQAEFDAFEQASDEDFLMVERLLEEKTENDSSAQMAAAPVVIVGGCHCLPDRAHCAGDG